MEKIKTTIKPEEGKFRPMEGENIPTGKIEQANARLAIEKEGKSPIHEIVPTEEESILDEMSPEDKEALELLRKEIRGMTIRVAEKSQLNRLDNIFVGSNNEVINALTEQLNKFKTTKGKISEEELRYCLQKTLETRDRMTAAGANERANYERGMNKLIAAMELLAQVNDIEVRDIITSYNNKMRQAA